MIYNGLLVCWFNGLLVIWYTGVSVYRFIGLSVIRLDSKFEPRPGGWKVGKLGSWRNKEIIKML